MASLLTPREAALRLGISYPAIKQWIYRGKLRAIKTPGGHYRIPESELDALQARITSEVIASGKAWFSTVIHAGRTWLRFNLVNLHTREDHIHRLADLVDRAARAISIG